MPTSVVRLTVAIFVLSAAALRGQTCGPWNWVNPLPQGNALQAVTWGNGRYVTVGRAGTILTSADGVSWALRSSGRPRTFWTSSGTGRSTSRSERRQIRSDRTRALERALPEHGRRSERVAWNDRSSWPSEAGVILTSPDGAAGRHASRAPWLGGNDVA